MIAGPLDKDRKIGVSRPSDSDLRPSDSDSNLRPSDSVVSGSRDSGLRPSDSGVSGSRDSGLRPSDSGVSGLRPSDTDLHPSGSVIGPSGDTEDLSAGNPDIPGSITSTVTLGTSPNTFYLGSDSEYEDVSMNSGISPSVLERDLVQCPDLNARHCPLPHPCNVHWERAHEELMARGTPENRSNCWADNWEDDDQEMHQCAPNPPETRRTLSPNRVPPPKPAKSFAEAKAVIQTKRALRGMANLAKAAFDGLPPAKRQVAELILSELTSLIEGLFDDDDSSDTPPRSTATTSPVQKRPRATNPRPAPHQVRVLSKREQRRIARTNQNQHSAAVSSARPSSTTTTAPTRPQPKKVANSYASIARNAAAKTPKPGSGTGSPTSFGDGNWRIFPVGKAGLGLALADPKDLETCLTKLDVFNGLKADRKQTRHPRVIVFNAAVSRNSSLASINEELASANPQLTAGINGTLVSNLHWRGNHLVLAVCPSLFQRMFGTSSRRLVLNRLSVRYDIAHDEPSVLLASPLHENHGQRGGGATILTLRGLAATTVLAEKDICIIRIANGGLYFASVYLHPNDRARREACLAQWFAFSNSLPNIKGIFGGDLNCWHEAWGNKLVTSSNEACAECVRGEEALDLITRTRGTILNDPEGYPSPTFLGGLGRESWADVTWSVGNVGTVEWELLSSLFTASDHRALQTILTGTDISYPVGLQLHLTDLEKVNELVFGLPEDVSASEISTALAQAVEENKLKAARVDFRQEVRAAKARDRARFYASLGDYSKCIRPAKGRGAPGILNGDPESNQAQVLLDKLFPTDPNRDRVLARLNAISYCDDGVLPPVTENEVSEAIHRLKISAPAEDQVNARVVKSTASILVPRWTQAFNTVFQNRVYPEQWRSGKCVALPKPGRSLHAPSSWRPVCLLSVSSKLLAERLIHELGDHLRSPALHEFIRGRSCDTALRDIIKAYRVGLDRHQDAGKVTALTALDVSNAFNSLRHSFILAELRQMGISKYLVDLIQSWLTNQTVSVSFGAHSAGITLERGVPQGSILGPLLFVASTISLSRALNRSFEGATVTSSLFADDMTIVINASGVTAFREAWRYVEGNLDRAVGRDWTCLRTSATVRNFPRPTRPHLRKKVSECRRRLACLVGLAWVRAGITHKKAARTYNQGVFPHFSHGVSAWGDVLHFSWAQKLVDSVSGMAARIVLRAPRNSSYAAVTIMAGLQPAHIQLLSLLEVQRDWMMPVLPLRDCPGRYREMVWKPDTRLPHPLPPWAPTLAIEPREKAIERATECGRHCAIFTDGSKFHESSGGGIIAFVHNKPVHQSYFRLPGFCSIAQCELIIAIRDALRWLRSTAGQFQIFPGTRWYIFTDSQAAIKSLGHRHSVERCALARDITVLCQGINVSIRWCPGHEGVDCNELADQLPNVGRKQLYPLAPDVPPRLSRSFLKRRAKEKAEELTRQWWCLIRPRLGATVREFFWPFGHARRTRADSSYETRPRPAPGPPCGAEDGTTMHYIRDCPLLDGARKASNLYVPKYLYKYSVDPKLRGSLVAKRLAFGLTLIPVHHADGRSARAQYSAMALVAGVASLSAPALETSIPRVRRARPREIELGMACGAVPDYSLAPVDCKDLLK
ncbi:hypothetical protein FOL47_000322, partial [Perkinsus chesapeaki]